MTQQEVKNRIGEENWDKFIKWMYGQTMGLNEDGTLNYYEWDVERFYRNVCEK